jgi:hypothetical protein
MPIDARHALVTAAALIPLAGAPASASAAQDPIGLQLYVGHGPQTEYETVYVDRTEPLWVETARPAYVAIFEITPQGDLQLLRPFYLGEVLRTGRGTQFVAVADPFRPYWAPAGLGIGYVFAVASDEPIRVPRDLDGVGRFFRTSASFNYRMFNVGFRSWDVIDGVAAATGATEISVVQYLSFPGAVPRATLRVPTFLGGSVLITQVAAVEPQQDAPPAHGEPASRERESWRSRNGERLQDTGGITVVAYDEASWSRRDRWEDTSWLNNVWNRRGSRWSSSSGLTSASTSWSGGSNRATTASGTTSSTSWRQRGSSTSSSPDARRSWTGHRDD